METGAAMASHDPAAGARNLLLHCAGAKPGESLLIVFETDALGIYGAGLVEILSDAALELGLTVATREVAFSKAVQDLPADLSEQLRSLSGHHAQAELRTASVLASTPLPGDSVAALRQIRDVADFARSAGARELWGPINAMLRSGPLRSTATTFDQKHVIEGILDAPAPFF